MRRRLLILTHLWGGEDVEAAEELDGSDDLDFVVKFSEKLQSSVVSSPLPFTAPRFFTIEFNR